MNVADKYGLGAFASLLDDGIIPKRPSEEVHEKPIPGYLIVSGKDKKSSSPDKNNPHWKFGKPKYPHIIRKKMEHADELTELHCGCKCTECITNYRAYWEERAYSKELFEALKAERDSMKDVVEEVRVMEKDFKDKLSEAELTVTVVENKHRLLLEDIEKERQLRANETYRREVVNAETENLYKQIKELEESVAKYSKELMSLRLQNSQLKDWGFSTNTLKDNALAQAREHSQNVDRLEKDNSEIRLRLYQFEIECSKLQMKNEHLKERLSQVPDLRMARPLTNPNSKPKTKGIGGSAFDSASRISREPRETLLHTGSSIAGDGHPYAQSISSLSAISGYTGVIRKQYG